MSKLSTFQRLEAKHIDLSLDDFPIDKIKIEVIADEKDAQRSRVWKLNSQGTWVDKKTYNVTVEAFTFVEYPRSILQYVKYYLLPTCLKRKWPVKLVKSQRAISLRVLISGGHYAK